MRRRGQIANKSLKNAGTKPEKVGKMVRPTGFEPVTSGFGGQGSDVFLLFIKVPHTFLSLLTVWYSDIIPWIKWQWSFLMITHIYFLGVP